jgi:hypothetical protein
MPDSRKQIDLVEISRDASQEENLLLRESSPSKAYLPSFTFMGALSMRLSKRKRFSM